MSFASRCLALLSAFFMCLKIPARRWLHLLTLAILAIAANTQVAFADSNACLSLNVQITSQAGEEEKFTLQDGSNFAADEEFVFTITTKNSHSSEMVANTPENRASASALWYSNNGGYGEYRPGPIEEVDETVIIQIDVTDQYTFNVMGSTLTGTGVTSQGSASMTLTCRASSGSASTDATLSSLIINSGTLSPNFGSGTTTYTASVINGVTSLTVTPTSNGGSIKINGVSATSAQGFPVALNPGPNNIEIEVTAADGVTKQTYSLTVTRAAAPPTVTNISPSTGKTAGGTSVTITGTDFTGATSVTIGGELATNVDVESATEITAKTPANGVGAVDVVVTTPAGNGTLSNGFTYTKSTPNLTVSAPNPSPALGESVTFTATLSNGSAPSGNVTFKDGTNTIGTISISISGTTATYTTTSLTAGSHSITAEYGGDTNNAAATSAAIAVTVAAPTFTFSPAGGALSSARVGSRYDQTVTANASGITAPISYSVKTGALPSGLTLNTASGEISGTPTTAGIYSFTIEATDNATPPNTGSATYALTVNPAATLVFSPAGGSLPEAMAGEEYSQPISATGGTGATTYRIPTGSPLLPAGLVLNVSTGELAGSLDANTEGDYSFTIEASDNTGATATASYTLHVAARAVTVDDKTVTVSAGSAPNNVNLAAGATGGPFDSAEIISNTQSNAGSFAIVNGEFAQASGPTPTGWYMKFIPNPAFSGRVSVGFRLTSTLGVSNTGTITYNIAYDPAEVAYEIDTLVYGFVQTRQNLISSTIKVPGLLERRQMARATAPVATRMTPSAQGITLGFSTSLAQMKAARDNSDGIVSDEQLPFNVWIDGTFLAHNRKDNGDKWGNFAMVSAGADYLLSPRALIGLSFHFDHMTDPTEENATLTGNGWFAGPNASLEIGKGIFWDTSLLYGGSANSIDTQFWDGSFDTTRWMFDTSISGQWNIDDVTTLTPKLRALYFSETAEDYSVTNSDGDVLTIEGFTQDQLRVSLGAELARQFTLENDNILTPKIGLTGGVTDRDSNRAFGQLSAGLSLDTASNWNIDAGLLYNFSADDEKSLGVKVGIGGKF